MLVSMRIVAGVVINMSLLCRAGAKECGVGSETKSCVLCVCVCVRERAGRASGGVVFWGVFLGSLLAGTCLCDVSCVCVCVTVCVSVSVV